MFFFTFGLFWNVTQFCEGKVTFGVFWRRFSLIGITPPVCYFFFVSSSQRIPTCSTGLHCYFNNYLYKRGLYSILNSEKGLRRPPLFWIPKQAFFRGKALFFIKVDFVRVYTHGSRLFLKKGFFVRKNDLFFDGKWLFCEGKAKMSFLET